jgi:hypothetical protein
MRRRNTVLGSTENNGINPLSLNVNILKKKSLNVNSSIFLKESAGKTAPYF